MELPLAPSWLPTWVIVLNTLIVETALVVAFYRLVVRRSAKPRRARWLFVAGVVLLSGAQNLGLWDVFGSPHHEGYRLVDRLGRSEEASIFFSWSASRVFGRRVHRVISIRPNASALGLPDQINIGERDPYTFGHSHNRWIVDREFVESLWPFLDAPNSDETRRQLWQRFSSSNLAAADAEIARIISGA